MRREIIFASAAQLEYDEAILWYDEQQPGLGDEFETEINAVIQEILKNPEFFRFASTTIRKTKLLRKFLRYSIYFYVDPSHIGIVAVFDGARNPEELRRRLK
jgi:plasmid stabilization system protein ParE